MPIVKIFTAHPPAPDSAEALAGVLSAACTDVLAAHGDAVQVVLVPGSLVLRGAPSLVEVHYRARPDRGVDVLDRFMDQVGAACWTHLGQRPRIRCFAIDQATLFARH